MAAMRGREPSTMTDVDAFSSSTLDECRVGRVRGLTTRADLNGRLARAVRWVPSKGRWALVMDSGEKVLVRDEHIDFEQAPDAKAVVGKQVAPPVVGQPVDGAAAESGAVVEKGGPPSWLVDALRCFCLPIAKPEPARLA